jgi:ubiquinone/menaquinone biosynthesis C-methylase UbiE
MSDAHADDVARAFTQQAAAFEDGRVNRVFTADAAWLFARLPRTGAELVLDVAAGTGHAARSLAPSVRAVIAVDATDAMLARGQAAARDEGVTNIVFARADAAALPFLDGSFDIVVCRFALHHFEAPEAKLAEMRRCLRPGGQLALADLVADADPAIADVQNALERLRDPSHTRMWSAAELVALVDASGFTGARIECRALGRPLEPWLTQAGTPPDVADAIRSRLRDELAGGAATGFAPAIDGGELTFTQTFGSCLATRAD